MGTSYTPRNLCNNIMEELAENARGILSTVAGVKAANCLNILRQLARKLRKAKLEESEP